MVWILVVTGDSGYSDYTPRMAAGNNFWDFQQNLSRKRDTSEPASGSGASATKPLTVSQLTARIEKAIKAGVPATVAGAGGSEQFQASCGFGARLFHAQGPSACIDCVMFRSDAVNLKFTPADGLELVATGRVGVFAQRGRYQFYATSLQPLGQGALELARQQIQARLQARGTF